MDEPGGTGRGADERKSRRGKASGGVKQGLGVLSALKDALEETIADARERGDLSPERAKEALRSAMARAQEAAGETKDRLDFASQKEVDHLKERVEELRIRLENLERRVAQAPDAGPSRTEAQDGSG